MWYRTLTTLTVFAFVAVSAPAQAEDFTGLYWHQGSKMRLELHADALTIRYVEPRAGLPVTPGTVLFSGRVAGIKLAGLAKLFSSKCGPITYPVSGEYETGRPLFTLSGRVPVRDATCTVVGYSSRGENAELLFGDAQNGS